MLNPSLVEYHFNIYLNSGSSYSFMGIGDNWIWSNSAFREWQSSAQGVSKRTNKIYSDGIYSIFW